MEPVTNPAQPEQRRQPLVYVIVLNWNGWQDTIECLRSLEAVSYAAVRILVVDNGSTDCSVRRIREAFPSLSILCTRANLGYAGGNNAGLVAAAAHGADAVLFLNNDTVVTPTFLEPLVAALWSEPSVGLVGPRILHWDRDDTVWFDGARFRPYLGQTMHLGFAKCAGHPEQTPCPTDFVSGCALLVRMNTLKQSGAFDNAFFCYSEDADLSLRVRDLGLRCLCVPSSLIWHKVGRSAGSELSPTYLYYTRRNRLLLMLKHGKPYHWPTFLVHYSLSYFVQTLLALMAARDGSQSRGALVAAIRDFGARRFGRYGGL